MTSVFNKIAPKPSFEGKTGQNLWDLSLEEEINELTSVMDDTVEQSVSDAAEIHEDAHLIARTDAATAGVTTLVDNMTETASAGNLDADKAEIYRASMEALIIASGLNFTVENFIPSFESFESAEAAGKQVEEKSGNVLVRMFRWLGKALSKLVESVRGFFSKMWTNIPSMKKLATKVKESIAAAGDSAENTKAFGFGAQAQYLCDAHGKINTPGRIMEDVNRDYAMFMTNWTGLWGHILAIETPTDLNNGVRLGRFIIDIKKAIDSMGAGRDIKFQLAPMSELELKMGSDKKNPLTGAKISVNKTLEKFETEAPVIPKGDLMHGVDVVISFLTTLEKSQEKIDPILDKARKNTKLAGEVTVVRTSKSSEETKRIEEAGKAIAAMRGSYAAMTSGFTTAIPMYLQYVRANLKYLAASAKRYKAA